MSTSTSDTNLTASNQCSACFKKEKVSPCEDCNVVVYCSQDHQLAHLPTHKPQCDAIKQAQVALEKEEADVRAEQGEVVTLPGRGATMFEEYAGYFWEIPETRQYMRARRNLLSALLIINTELAVKAALDNILEMLRLCKGDHLGVRDLAPSLYLRLERDQECYDFLKWWSTDSGDHDWDDMEAPFLNLKNEDVLEDLKEGNFGKRFSTLSHTASVMLIKIRLVEDLKALQNSAVLGEKIPQEILYIIQSHVVGSIVAEKRYLMESKDLLPRINEIEDQIEKLYRAIDRTNQYFWPAMLKPGRHLTANPTDYCRGNVQEMQLALQYCHASWEETPGAKEKIRALRGDVDGEKDPDDFKEDSDAYS